MDTKAYLEHHGIKGQKWGVRRWQYKNGSLTPEGRKHYGVGVYIDGATDYDSQKQYRKRFGNSVYNKRHIDETLRAGSKLQTLSYDKNRTSNADMFYATHTRLDDNQYNALFNAKLKQPISGIETSSTGYKFRISNKLVSDTSVASEDSSVKIFSKLFEKDPHFRRYVLDPNRMESYFVKDKYKFKGYREAKEALDNVRKSGKNVNYEDLAKIYRMFNYTIPAQGVGVDRNRTKFFNACKEAGYGAILDTNDAIYGGFKARSPVIVIDMDKVVLDSVKETTLSSKQFSSMVVVGRKMLRV